MTDLAKMMSPIRDTIARTREKMEQIERLLITATEADKLDCTSAAECAVEQARRMLEELSGDAGELPTANTWITANGDRVGHAAYQDTPASDTIDRTLPPGFEVRKFTHGWYPCCDFMNGMCRVYISGDKTWTTSRDYWTGDCGYLTEPAAYADKARWLKAAGVDWPEVTGPHEDGNYDVRTSTHWWLQSRELWTRRNRLCDVKGVAESKKEAERHLPAACRAWVEMQKEAGR